MNKIREIGRLVQSGARGNKYRLLMNFFEPNDIDILCYSTSAPGREIGTVEVFLRGRKFQLSGDIIDDGTWEMTIYNTPDLIHRRFFMRLLQGIQNYDAPAVMGDIPDSEDLNVDTSSVDFNSNGGFSSGLGNSSALGSLGSIGKVLQKIDNTINTVSNVRRTIETSFNRIRSNYQNIKNTGRDLSNFLSRYGANTIPGSSSSGTIITSKAGYDSIPWYQQDIIIQQLDHNDLPISETILHNAFVTNVSNIELDDSQEGISSTTVSFAYTNMTIQDEMSISLQERF